jgi:hypothetical protein
MVTGRAASGRVERGRRRLATPIVVLFSQCLVGLCAGLADAAETALRYNRDIRPILAGHCFSCHGPDKANRKAELRLDERDSAVNAAESGVFPISPGRPEASELVRRIFADDPDELMPPPTANKPLSPAQKELLRRWIAEGAAYERHWAFLPINAPPIPVLKSAHWPRNAIDCFILARLEEQGLQPSAQADNATLLRRLSFDLTGLPPTLAQLEAFESEMTAVQSPRRAAGEDNGGQPEIGMDAVYERWVDRFLNSPHYGERMAVDWLDAARFADTNGYQVDRDREMYAWRDWVIDAFNSNMPFDRFTIEQLAGDLLPSATLEQKIATGFHRNHILMEEGGAIPEEFLAEYCADRVETTATVWLGQTFNCARCHDHKFDLFTQRDYYGLYAFFHNVTETGIGDFMANTRRNAPPMLKLPAPLEEARLNQLGGELAQVKQDLLAADARIAAVEEEWELRLRQAPAVWRRLELASARAGESALAFDTEAGTLRLAPVTTTAQSIVLEARLPTRATALRLEFARRAGQDAVLGETTSAQTVELGELRLLRATESAGQPLALRAAEVEDSLPKSETAKALDAAGKGRASLPPEHNIPRVVIVAIDLPAPADAPPDPVRIELSLTAKEESSGWGLGAEVTDSAADLLVPAEILRILKKPRTERTAEEMAQVAFLRQEADSEHRELAKRIAALNKQIDETDLKIPTTMVMQEMATPRRTNVLIRGAYNQPGDQVLPETPAALPAFPADSPRNRVGLARWLVDPANPLPARVTVNRLWQSLFGTGLVRTSEDFGVQGEPPTHPELLDWLAAEFIRNGWNIKAMMRLLVTSSTYRQSSRLTAALQERDPENRLLARGPRFRLQGEFLRDQALAASGLLVRRIGGPSVRPYHPPGLYEQVAVPGLSAGTYVPGKGDELYRRSLYTYWRRSVPNPSLLLFDMPFRETCSVRRPRTNTPLQALNLMNDPTYVEAARFLAERMAREGGDSLTDRVEVGFRLALARRPRPAELAILVAAYQRALRDFESDSAAADDLLKVGESPASGKIDSPQLAALAIVATTILNLDETLTKE